MAPHHALDNQGMPKGSTKSASETLSVRKDAHNAGKPAVAGVPPHRRDWQAGNIPQQQQAAAAPTIRVIHIFAPKVIKTDMANFRSTVQKLTGRSTKKRGRSSAGRAKTMAGASTTQATPSPAVAGQLWDQERRSQEEAVLHRLVGDACGTNVHPLVRSNSVESSTYSGDSTETTDGLPSPTAADSFNFYVPHRQSAYSLSEIPAPFFIPDMMMNPGYTVTTSPAFGADHALGLHLPAPVMESMLSTTFDVDSLGSGLGSPLPLTEPLPGCVDVPFPSVLGSGSASGGLYDMLSVQQHCRLSVQQPSFQGGNFFEMI